MKAQRIEDGYLLVLGAGDEVVQTILGFAGEHRLASGFFTGLGAVRNATIAYLDLATKEYVKKTIAGDLELLSLTGNLSRMDGRPALHAHVTLGDREMRVQGGHLFSAEVSVTVEICLRVSGAEIVRCRDERFGANLIAL